MAGHCCVNEYNMAISSMIKADIFWFWPKSQCAVQIYMYNICNIKFEYRTTNLMIEPLVINQTLNMEETENFCMVPSTY